MGFFLIGSALGVDFGFDVHRLEFGSDGLSAMDDFDGVPHFFHDAVVVAGKGTSPRLTGLYGIGFDGVFFGTTEFDGFGSFDKF